MKRCIKFGLLIAAMLALVVFAVSCTSAESISVSEDSEFQAVYVRGQELNLSGVILNVNTGKKTTEIGIDEKGVTVYGYDKDALGKQTVKIEYGGAVTEIEVTVVDRVVVKGAITDYLVGDGFDNGTGMVKITDYDGSSRSIQLSSNSITVSGFDSSVAKSNLSLTVKYTKDGESCEGSFNVNIHEIESVEFHEPNKITYNSHYTDGVDASGGRFVIKGNGGTIRRETAITDDMIKGLDMSAVSAENPSVKQTLTVTFGGKEYYYDVQLLYTDVSLFLDSSEQFNAVNWEGESEPEIEQELGELALSLMSAYVDMPRSEKDLLDEATVFNVARAAMSYGFNIWADNIRLFKGVFAIEYGECVLYLDSYERVESSLALFDEADSAIYTVAPLLLELIELYGDSVVYENESERIYFSSYPIMDSSELTFMRDTLEHALDVYDLVKDIPDNWREVGLEDYYTSLRQTVIKILGEGYVYYFSDMYYLISEWREENDLFDMLYVYLYEADESELMETLIICGMPNGVQTLYAHLLTAVMSIYDISNYEYLDSTRLIYNYYIAKDLASALSGGADCAEKYLYESVSVNLLFGVDESTSVTLADILEYVRKTVLGFTDGLVEDETYDGIIKDYVAIIEKCGGGNDYEGSEAYGESVKALFDRFVSLSPAQQYNVVAIFNVFYKNLGIPSLSFDAEDSYAAYASLFNTMISDFMRSKLSSENQFIYDELILAIEVFANRYDYTEWQSDFTARMDKVATAAEGLVGEDKESFEYYLKAAYDKYAAIRASLDKATDLGEWADKLDALSLALRDVQTAGYLLTSGTSYNYNYFLASYEKALAISAELMSAPESIIYAYYYEPLFEAYSAEDGTEAILWTFDYTICTYREIYASVLLNFGSEGADIYDVYYELELDVFLAEYYGMLSAFVNKTDATPVFDKDSAVAVVNAFGGLSSKAKALFATLEGNLALFDSARELLLTEAFTENAAAVASKLFALEAALLNYEISGSELTLTTVVELYGELEALYTELEASSEDKASFAPFENIYSYYAKICEELSA